MLLLLGIGVDAGVLSLYSESLATTMIVTRRRIVLRKTRSEGQIKYYHRKRNGDTESKRERERERKREKEIEITERERVRGMSKKV